MIFTIKQKSRRVEQNSELKRGNYGRISSNGIYFWTRGIYSRGKTYKDLKRKRNSRRGLQGRVIHSVTVVCSAIYRSMELITTWDIETFLGTPTSLKSSFVLKGILNYLVGVIWYTCSESGISIYTNGDLQVYLWLSVCDVGVLFRYNNLLYTQ